MTSKFAVTAIAALVALSAPAFAEGDVAKGEKEFGKCKSCHTIASADDVIVKGGKTGPNLYGVIGRTAGTGEDFKYGDDIVAAGEKGLVWTAENIAEYMEDPKEFLQEYLGDKGAKSKMTFKMRKNQEDVAAYLATDANGAVSN
ncbi:cytochrome C550 [Oceanicola sp. 22II-s10i]|uniref:c-type cytochrome n=1 Tax=Oceanicola sp. 22II-s10i TaxID=1317116 RepID=UPI000B5272BA|nr:cytochrome C [Oceanicola sp. 22II-s10i]OWU85254.1 cytochrome C550 [Oceanicola sp. 22II-s10i]